MPALDRENAGLPPNCIDDGPNICLPATECPSAGAQPVLQGALARGPPSDDPSALAVWLMEMVRFMPPERASERNHIEYCARGVPQDVPLLQLVKRLLKARARARSSSSHHPQTPWCPCAA